MRVSRMVHDPAAPCSQTVYWYHPTMALLPVTIPRRLRGSGFTEEQVDVLDEASEAAAEAARQDLARQNDVNRDFSALWAEIRAMRAEMQSLKWWLFGALSTVILAATAAMIAAFVVWG